MVSGPYASASTAPIVDADISAVAVHALLRDDLLGRKVPLTGPQALTNAELVDVIGDVLGRPLRYQEVPPDLVRRRFIGLGFSAEFADAYMALLEATVSKPALVTNEVEKILGRPPQTFGDAIRAHRDLFSQLAKETEHVRTSPAPLPQADEPRREGDAAAGCSHRAGNDPDRARQEDAASPVARR